MANKENNGNKQWIKEAKTLMKKNEEEREALLKRMKIAKPEKADFIEEFIAKETARINEKDNKLMEKLGISSLDELKTDISGATGSKVEEEKTKEASKPAAILPKEKKSKTVKTEEKSEQRKKGEKQVKISMAVETAETYAIEQIPGVSLYTLEKLKENGPNRETKGEVISRKANNIAINVSNKTVKLTHEKIADKVTSTFKVLDADGDVEEFEVFVPEYMLYGTRFIKNFGGYDHSALIPINIPDECNPLKVKGLKSYLRINVNARVEKDKDGYHCAAQIGFKKNVIMSLIDPELRVTTWVPYVNLNPLKKSNGSRYLLKAMLGPLNPKEIKAGSRILGPSHGLSIKIGDVVKPATVYLIAEPIEPIGEPLPQLK